MITVRSDSPPSVAQLFPAASIVGSSPIDASLPLNQARASRHTGPHARRCAPSGVDVRAASSRRFVMTSRALMGAYRVSIGGLTKAANRRRLRFKRFNDLRQPRDGQQLLHATDRARQLERGVVSRGGKTTRDELADKGTVDKGHLGKVD